MTGELPFSLLLPFYAGDRADFLQRAFDSSVREQTRPPAEVVLVQDGPVSEDVLVVRDRLVADSPVPVRLLVLAENVGLGPTLNAGLTAATHEVVARMDADDVSLPERFARQLPLIEAGADLVGAAIAEFTADESAPGLVRTPPVGAGEIARQSRLHQPVYHPTVVYRRTAVEAAGGYEDLPQLEDYWLIARMIARGARVENVAEPLLLYRVGAGAYSRRGGWSMLRSELQLQNRFRGIGFVSTGQYLRNVGVRGGYRLVPESARKAAYRRWVALRRR